MLMLGILAFSAFFIAAEADHDCSGDDCPICMVLQQCENTVRNIASGDAAAAVSAVLVVFVVLLAIFNTHFYRNTSPVNLKTRLNY